VDILNLDIVNTLRSLVTVLAFATFIGITLWAWNGARRAQFAEAARIPLEEDQLHLEAGPDGSNNTKSTITDKTDAERSGK
jgi:cytochrome c oxidase cbb3-type subunit 4